MAFSRKAFVNEKVLKQTAYLYGYYYTKINVRVFAHNFFHFCKKFLFQVEIYDRCSIQRYTNILQSKMKHFFNIFIFTFLCFLTTLLVKVKDNYLNLKVINKKKILYKLVPCLLQV